MDSKLGITTQKPLSYDDFEPFCNWRRNEGRNTLILHLPDFKKEQLKVKFNIDERVLKISGERPLGARSRFYKEVKVEKEFNANEIKATFTDGLLHLVIPKTTAPDKVAAQLGHEKAHKQQNVRTTTECDEASKKHSYDEEYILIGKQESGNSNMTTKTVLAIGLASAIGVYIFYRYKVTCRRV